ncbi:DER1-domain-containing protein [Pleomassaria siparia CBS 279.74]|uniref:Derlin n=1 Tax=Pleomassaria siparia CBS 279.74 TaxID=1314801 RepID=A0A6G1KRV4_9PLEO|nr:DER1-domain-containing protein [Pleomassaria siparia CBS 279.74]
MDVFWTLPPVTRTITALAVIISALGYSGMISLSDYVFVSQYVFTYKTVPQVWRLLTSFLITKPKFGILMDPYFIYQYGSGLERESTRFSQPGDFFVYTFCLCMTIIATAGVLLRGYTFLQPLSLAFAYTYAQDNPTRQVSFFIVTFDAKYLPFAMLFLSFILDGPDAALTQAMGLIAAHLYDFLTRIWPTFGGGTNPIFTPVIVKRWFGGHAGSVQSRAFGSVQQGRPRENPAVARSSGRSTGVGGQWDGRGPGQRLGEQ